MSAFYRAMAAGVLSLHAAYIAWVIFGALFTRSRRGSRRCTLAHCCMESLSKSLDSGVRSRHLNSGLRYAAAFPRIAALSFCTISTL